MQIEVQFDKIIDGEQYHDSDVERKVMEAIGNVAIEGYIQDMVDKVMGTIDGAVKKPDYLGLRIIASKHLAHGYAFKTFKDSSTFPGIVIGFAGDIDDFELTIIHELLHYVGWDEYIVEEKSKEIKGADK